MRHRNSYLIRMLLLAGVTTAEAAHVQNVRGVVLGKTPVEDLPAKLGLGPGNTFKAAASIQATQGTQVVRMQQHYKGVPIYGFTLAVERKADGRIRADGRLLQHAGSDLASVKPRLDESSAQATFSAVLPPMAPRSAGAKLHIYVDDSERARLAYLVYFNIDVPAISRPMAIVDANTGEIIKEWQGLARDADNTGTYNDWQWIKGDITLARGVGGNPKVGLYTYGREYPALAVTQDRKNCWLKNKYVVTYGLNEFGRPGPQKFACPYNPSYLAAANNAHHYAGVVVDMYRTWFGEPPVDLPVKIVANSSVPDGTSGWDGEAVHLGKDGNGRYAPAVLDLIAHEISHGFTEKHTNLYFPRPYLYFPRPYGLGKIPAHQEVEGAAAAVAEAFSDMAGEAAEFYSRGSNDFLVGAEIFEAKDDALRHMCNPTRDGKSIDHMKDYSPDLTPHQAAGVFNKAFCLLAKTDGWDTRKAFEVFYLANKVLWTPLDSAEEAVNGVENAARVKGYRKLDVTAAFADVGLSSEEIEELANGEPVAIKSGGRRSVKNYKIAVPPGARTLNISISGGKGNADLYVKHEALPTSFDSDCRLKLADNNETCSYNGSMSPATGTYFVQVRGRKAYSGVVLMATWTY